MGKWAHSVSQRFAWADNGNDSRCRTKEGFVEEDEEQGGREGERERERRGGGREGVNEQERKRGRERWGSGREGDGGT